MHTVHVYMGIYRCGGTETNGSGDLKDTNVLC